MPKSEFQIRRQALVNSAEEDSILIIPGYQQQYSSQHVP